MPPEFDHASEVRPDPARFATTHWSVVLAAVSDSSPAALGALEQLGRTYWRPLYHYARRRGCDPHEAQDVIQEFFRFILEKHVVERADRSRGRFRTFLLTTLQNFLANERRQARAAKRGGGQPVLSLDTATAEVEFSASAPEGLAPDAAYDRRWALAALDEAMAALEAAYERSGNPRSTGPGLGASGNLERERVGEASHARRTRHRDFDRRTDHTAAHRGRARLSRAQVAQSWPLNLAARSVTPPSRRPRRPASAPPA